MKLTPSRKSKAAFRKRVRVDCQGPHDPEWEQRVHISDISSRKAKLDMFGFCGAAKACFIYPTPTHLLSWKRERNSWQRLWPHHLLWWQFSPALRRSPIGSDGHATLLKLLYRLAKASLFLPSKPVERGGRMSKKVWHKQRVRACVCAR